jgi:hypothetical protein
MEIITNKEEFTPPDSILSLAMVEHSKILIKRLLESSTLEVLILTPGGPVYELSLRYLPDETL